ncbi:MmcQ/YjbR family DNA-binding protein [Bacillus sp. FJAT-42376]|uniref:MmcQ/YjbR family DNA-binding protein n=1 Tax=Bacillus sp. FJAT-42376 TaxID=2014076 RepID=UPI000F5063D7|nr:MmcQ/YjbR family DNA-binding protein [Bacillus sp. FJAT-42376]AZB41317.1 MmcQ/YjbR family DNA-binding protein [Bacillus sp. FJAT-42376]
MNKKRLHAICSELPGTIHDYQPVWEADRYHICGKMFALIGSDTKRKQIITLKCDPYRAEELRETYEGIIPGYHMNKTHWNSIYLDSNVPDHVMEALIQHSHQLVLKNLPKKVQIEIESRSGGGESLRD